MGTVWFTVTSRLGTDYERVKHGSCRQNIRHDIHLRKKGNISADRVKLELSNGAPLVEIGNFGEENSFLQILAEDFLNALYKYNS